MASTIPTRVDRDLYDAAKTISAAQSRSTAQQIEHWARIGREFEASRHVNHRDVALVLAGGASYDALTEAEQAVVRATWDEQDERALVGLNFAAEFTAAADTWSEADATGTVTQHG